jgi:hypothetical protein
MLTGDPNGKIRTAIRAICGAERSCPFAVRLAERYDPA